MKTSIFDMNFTLPPMVVMTQVEKDMPTNTTYRNCNNSGCGPCGGPYPDKNIYL